MLFTDLPLGNPCGAPWDTAMQARILAAALRLFDAATVPGTIERSPERWAESDEWKARYAEVTPENAAKLKAMGDARRAMRAQLKAAPPP
ncbi:MAG: hypothetical protein R3E84_19185 [Pseudomonadales bacterium]